MARSRPKLRTLGELTAILASTWALPALATEPAVCIEGVPFPIPAVGAASVSEGAAAQCTSDARQTPEYWRSRFCEDPVGFCRELEAHPLPSPPCSKPASQIIDESSRTPLEASDVKGLYPQASLQKVRSILPAAIEAVGETLQSPKWQAPPSVIQQLRGIHLVDPNDPDESAENIQNLNTLCGTAIPVPTLRPLPPPLNDLPPPLVSVDAEGRRTLAEPGLEELPPLPPLPPEPTPDPPQKAGGTTPSQKMTRDMVESRFQAAVLGQNLLVCPGVLKVAQEGSPESLLAVILHELAHVAGPCHVGRGILNDLKRFDYNLMYDLLDRVRPESNTGCKIERKDVVALQDGQGRLDFSNLLHSRMSCFEESGLSKPGSRDWIQRETDQVNRRLGYVSDSCTRSAAQWSPDRTDPQSVTGLLQACPTEFLRELIASDKAALDILGPARVEAKRLRPVRARIALARGRWSKWYLPNENQFGEAFADAIAASSLPGAMKRLRPSATPELEGLLQAPALMCLMEQTGLFKNRKTHGNAKARVQTWQWSPEMRTALGCSASTASATLAGNLESCLRKPPQE